MILGSNQGYSLRCALYVILIARLHCILGLHYRYGHIISDLAMYLKTPSSDSYSVITSPRDMINQDGSSKWCYHFTTTERRAAPTLYNGLCCRDTRHGKEPKKQPHAWCIDR